VVFFDNFTPPVKSHDQRRSLKGAHHDNDSSIFTNMSNWFNSATDQVQVNKGFAVQDTDRVTILGRAIDMSLWIKRSRRHENDRLCIDPLPNPLIDFLVDLAHSNVIGNGIGTARLIPGTETVKCLIQFRLVPARVAL